MSEEKELANAQLIPIIAQKLEVCDEDYLGECAKSIIAVSEK